MIEIPNLEQASYAQHELDQLQEQYNQTGEENELSSFSGSRNGRKETLLNGNMSRFTPVSFAGKLDSPIDLHDSYKAPYFPTSQMNSPSQSPLVTGRYGQPPIDYNENIAFDNNTNDRDSNGVRMSQHGLSNDTDICPENDEHTRETFSTQNSGTINSTPRKITSASAVGQHEVYESASAFMISSVPDGSNRSQASIQLSEYAEELASEPHEVEYYQAEQLRMVSKTFLSPSSDAKEIEVLTGEKTPLKNPPSHEYLTSLASESPDKPNSKNFFSLQNPGTPNLQSALEPSPQLPPPSARKQLSKVHTQGDEFHRVRKLTATERMSSSDYTLHIVYTQFFRFAEQKLNRCIEFPLDQEPPILDILAEGIDPRFDNIIYSLGYVAKRKPKQLVDRILAWRKSKSDVAIMASAEVEKVTITRARSATASGNMGAFESITSQNSQSSQRPRGKRSLSLMRTKSLSKLAHRRNASVSVVTSNNSNTGQSEPGLYQDYNTDQIQTIESLEERLLHARTTAIQAERKSLASIYIVCRVLIEVVKKTSEAEMGNNLGRLLEDIVYNQLKTTNPVATSESFVRSANWNLFSELLGHLSEKRFLSVSDRFIADLEKVPTKISQEQELKTHLLIHGMRYLKLKNYPLENFEESAEFIQSLAKFFHKTENQTIALAYAEVLSSLLIPLASKLTAEANHPLWIEPITKIFTKASKLWYGSNPAAQSSGSYNRHGTNLYKGITNGDWDTPFVLMTSTLSVSSSELFSQNWFKLIEANNFKLKPKVESSVKTKLMICIARLLWVYLNRIPESLNNTIKKLERLFDLLFFGPAVSGKKQQWITLDMELIDSITEIIRIAAFQHYNFILESVILKLLRSSFNGTSLENSSPEKLILVIKSYNLCWRDQKLGERPEFPGEGFWNDHLNSAKFETQVQTIKGLFHKTHEESFKKWNKVVFEQKGLKNLEVHEEICKSFLTLLKLLDGQHGVSSITRVDSTYSSSNPSKSITSLSTFSFGLDFYQGTRNAHSDLFAILLDACAWTLVPASKEVGGSFPSGASIQNLTEILIRNSIHESSLIASSAISSLAKLACQKTAGIVLTVYAQVAFKITEKPGPVYDSDFFNSDDFIKLLSIYVELLKCWLNQFHHKKLSADNMQTKSEIEMKSNGNLDDLYEINHKAFDLTNLESSSNKLKPYEELEWKNTITLIEEVEGNGLFFLCSDDSTKRQLAISILKIVEQFDQSIYDNTDKVEDSMSASGSKSERGHSRSSSKYVADEGSRLIHHIESTDLLELIKPIRRELSQPERTRLSKVKNKKGILLKFASSDYGIDSTIWQRIFPRLMDILFEKCPMPVALCRSIVCVRLVQMHESVFAFSENPKTYTSSIFRSNTSSPPEVLINQWKLYLIFACCSLTSTNEQKISIPTQPNHGRKKSLPMYIQHQKITSAKSVFRMVLPLLKSSQQMIRESVVLGLSSININTFKTLADNLPSSINDWDIKAAKRDEFEDRARTEVIHILGIITYRFKSNTQLYSDDLTVANLVSIIKNVKGFLSIPSIQVSPEFQRLRYYFSLFLENVFVGLSDKHDIERWLPFEARIGCFNFLYEWCGYGDTRSILDERYTIMTKKANILKESATTVAILELEKKTFQTATLSCMATICSGALKQSIPVPGKTAVISFDTKGVMTWAHETISSETPRIQEIGKTALKNILVSNINSEDIYSEALRQCYNPQNSLQIREIYYTLVVESFMEFKSVDSMPFEMFSISTFLVGSDSSEIRYAAITCIKYIEEKFLGTCDIDSFTESVCCSTMVIYKKALFEISMKLASSHSGDAFTYISYLTKYFNVVDNSTRRDILACLLPWVQTVELNYSLDETNEEEIETNQLLPETFNEIDSPSLMVLNNLFEITVKFSKSISNEVEALWVALGTNPKNFDLIFEYLVKNCLERRSTSFVSHSRQIIAFLVFSKPDSTYILDKLISNLSPKAMIPLNPKFITKSELDTKFPYTANLTQTLTSNYKESTFSLGQISMVFLVDLLRSKNDMVNQHLPLLLHVCFSLLDHYYPIVQEQAVSLLIHLIHLIAPKSQKACQVMSSMRDRDNKARLWTYDDLNNDKRGGMTPKNMDLLVRVVLELFASSSPNLQHDWGRISLLWATSCAVRHIACRSFQIFRSLLFFLDQNMLKGMLKRLSNTIADDSSDIQGFAMQILMTQNAIIAELDSAELIDFPQLFWSSVACLSTIHEHEFIETISMMSKFVSKIDLDAPDTISCLISTFPPSWDGKFEGLQEIVLVGLRSATAWEPTLKFLDKLNKLRDSDIIGRGERRLIMTVVANLPRFLHAMDQKSINPDIEEASSLLSAMASNCGKLGLTRVLNSFSKNKFRTKKEFLTQTISTLTFFPEYESQILILLLNFLSNKTSWVKLEALRILKQVFPLVDLLKDEFTGLGADLISPLLRLLSTDYAEDALEVMDEALSISGSKFDQDFLQLSMGEGIMNHANEPIVSLFGLPDESGWAIAMPTMTASRTRHNVSAVCSTCGETSTVNDEKSKEFQANDNIQFMLDEYQAPPSDYGDSVSVSGEDQGASLSNMWAALDDFDSFFTKASDHKAQIMSVSRNKRHLHSKSSSSETNISNLSELSLPFDLTNESYDKRSSNILNRSLGGTPQSTTTRSHMGDVIGAVGQNLDIGHPEVTPSRKSYIPFRNSRLGKYRTDSFTTPTMNSTSAFESGASSTPSKLTMKSSVSGNGHSSPEVRISSNSPSNDIGNKFDHILGSGRKKKSRN